MSTLARKGLSEDWWSVILGLFLVVIVWLAYVLGRPLDFLQHAIPQPWPQNPLLSNLASHWWEYLLLWASLLLLTGIAVRSLGGDLGRYIAGFTLLFLLALIVLVVGSQQALKKYGLEYPFWALVIGLVLGNVLQLPGWLRAASGRTELFIKTSIVLLGANLPFSIVAKSGPKAFLEALLIVAAGFLVTFLVGSRLGVDPIYLSVIGAGASVCGVSAAIAVGNTVRAKSRQVGYVVSLVVLYGLVLIFVLPLLVRFLGLSQTVGGAWIGGSELADASGAAAAAILGEEAVKAFSLVKLSRDVLISVVCLLLGGIAVTRWSAEEQGGSAFSRLWARFPKFVLAFLVASLLSTWWQGRYGQEFAADFTGNLNAARTWLFTLTFLGIGLGTRFQEMREVGGPAIRIFTATVLANVLIGGLLAVWLFS